MTTPFLLSCFVLAFLAASSNARRTPFEAIIGELQGLTFGDDPTERLPGAFSLLRRKGGREESEKGFFLAARYVVPPELRSQFEDEWDKYEEGVIKEEGNEVIDLKKTTTDNLIYISYSEWNSFEDFEDHLDAGYVKDFVEFLEDKDISFQLLPLKKIADQESSKRRHHSAEVRHHGGKTAYAHLLLKLIVPPSEGKAFEDAWLSIADKTWDEERNRIYALHKVATYNNQYYVYGTWDDTEALQEHLESDHVAKLKEFADEHSLIWFLATLDKIGSQPE
jgi:quinol monooxygenase YgiN